MHLERILTFLQGGDDHAASAWRDRPLTADFASLRSRPGEVSRDRRLCGWLPPVRTPVRRSIDPVPTTRLPRVHMNVKSTSTQRSAADGLRCRALVGAFSGIGGTQSQQPVATPTWPLRELDRCRIRCIGGIAVQVKGAYKRQARRTLARRERGGAIRRVVAARRRSSRTYLNAPVRFPKASHAQSLAPAASHPPRTIRCGRGILRFPVAGRGPVESRRVPVDDEDQRRRASNHHHVRHARNGDDGQRGFALRPRGGDEGQQRPVLNPGVRRIRQQGDLPDHVWRSGDGEHNDLSWRLIGGRPHDNGCQWRRRFPHAHDGEAPGRVQVAQPTGQLSGLLAPIPN